MSKFPLQLLIKDTSTNREETLVCTGLLRDIPGRRQVYDALWNDRNVIAKVFSHKISAARHLKREWHGLKELVKRGLKTPEPLFYGKTKDRQYVVVIEKISGSPTVLDVFQKAQDSAQKIALLTLVGRELAKQHSKGVLQKDLHLGNFLISGDKVFFLDPGQMRFLRSEVDKKTSISQLAMLACYLSDSDTESIGKLCEEYSSSRGWRFARPEQSLLEKQIMQHQKKGIKKELNKCLRTSKRYLRIKTNRYVAVFDRDFLKGAEPLDFITQIDRLMDEGQILKNGGTSYVSRLSWNGSDVVVKRYNHKGLIHSLRHTIKKSRARRCWLHSQRLITLGVATPKPLAYIEQRKKKVVWKSYLITEYAEGQKLYDFLQDKTVPKDQHTKIIQQVHTLLEKLGKYRITHGDLKHTNILITDGGPTLTDLDGMKVHRWNLMYKIRKAKDLVRFENGG